MTAGPADTPILEGAEFREFWEEHLTDEARADIKRAVRSGDVMSDPGLAALAVSLARQYQRTPVWAFVLLPLLLVLWVGLFLWLLTFPGTWIVMIWRLFAALWVVMLPVKLGVWYRVRLPRYRLAEQVNLRELQDQ